LTEAFTVIYPSYPLPLAIAQLDSKNLNAVTILCDVYQGLNSITPLALAGQAESADASITWALGKLAAVGLDATTLGCPSSSLSPNFLTSNDTQQGGPLDPPPGVLANTGNNVYNKLYFAQSPAVPPKCHAGM
jgi:hypothetical protein